MALLGRGKFGVGLTGLAILFLIAGMIGFTFEGEVEGVPTPNAPNQAFFSDEPLPSNPLVGLLSTELTLTWDRDDVWIGIVDEDEKNRCGDIPSSFFSSDMGYFPLVVPMFHYSNDKRLHYYCLLLLNKVC